VAVFTRRSCSHTSDRGTVMENLMRASSAGNSRLCKSSLHSTHTFLRATRRKGEREREVVVERELGTAAARREQRTAVPCGELGKRVRGWEAQMGAPQR